MMIGRLKNKLCAALFWRHPKTDQPDIPASEYEVLEKIFVNNTIYLVKINGEMYYFRVIEDRTESLASVCRGLATVKAGALLGIESIYPKNTVARLTGLGLGVLQEKARGETIMTYTKEQRFEMLTPNFQRRLNDFNLADAICYEADHSPNNYNVVLDESGMLEDISCFDNNGKGTFSCRSSVDFITYKGVSKLVLPNGLINRPHLSREMADKLDGISWRQTYRCLHGYLKIAPILFFYRRLVRVRKSVRNTAKMNPEFLLSCGEWNRKTIEEELSGVYGKTYLGSLVNDCLPKIKPQATREKNDTQRERKT